MAPTSTIAVEMLPVRKKEKQRFTVLACANADGSEKFDLMIIGNANKPRAFNKRTGFELGFDYHANRKSWMTQSLFFNWLQRFDSHVARTRNRKVVLLLDKCTPHRSPQNLPDLQNVEIIFLPPNTTSKIEPMDAGVIASVKARYRSERMARAVDLTDENLADFYKVDILMAMRILRKIWNNLPSETIRNCWADTGLLSSSSEPSVCNEDASNEDLNALHSQIVIVAPATSRIDISFLLNSPGELDCTEELDSSQILFETEQCSESDLEGELIPHPLPPLNDQLKALSVENRILGAREWNSSSAIVALSRAQS